MPAGQPTKYDPSYCELLLDHMSKGLSFVSFGGVVGVCRDTLFEWKKVHKEFSDTYAIASTKSQLLWEQMGVDGVWNKSGGKFEGSKNLNNACWSFNMKNRFGWRDNPPEEKQDQTIVIKIDPQDSEL